MARRFVSVSYSDAATRVVVSGFWVFGGHASVECRVSAGAAFVWLREDTIEFRNFERSVWRFGEWQMHRLTNFSVQSVAVRCE